MHVSYESLEKKFPGEGKDRYNKIAEIVGAERLSGSFSRHDGGIDLTGVFAEDTAYTKPQQAEVERLAKTPTPKPQEPKKDGDK